MDRVILNTPCLPKRSYHAGNAISQIVTDIVYRYSKYLNKGKVFYVNHAWNVFGLVYENLAIEKYGTFEYEQTLALVNEEIQHAENEKRFFSEYDHDTSDFFTYIDSDPEFITYCEAQINKLDDLGYLKKLEDEFCLNIEKYLNEDGVVRLGQMINRVLINPEYQSKSIVSNLNELDKYYPLTKKRRFAMQIRINGDDYALNPIFQSLLMPAYICKIAGTKLPCYFQASSSGHSMLKWHFLRIILNDILFGEVPYSHLFLHGNILGLNGKPMSKHAGNAVQPSELFRELKDKRFVRYMLIKSISFKDVLIQIDLSKNEYLKIKTKLDQLENGLRVKSTEKIVSLIEGGFKELERMNFKLALENLYLVCRKAELVDGLEGNEELTKKFMALKNILLN